MLLRELFESILLEYNREKTAATFGKKLLKAFIADRSVIQGPLGTSRQYLLQIQGQEIGPHEKQSQQMIINDILSVIEQGDPTQHKEYSQWLVKCYANEDVILEDIISKGRDWLEVYDEMKRRKILPAHYRDIMTLKFKDLYYVINDPELVAKLNTQSADVDKGNSKVVFENAAVRIIKPEDETAACYYGQGTTWCTAARNNNMFNYYHTRGPMFILLPKQPSYDGEKYQIHLQSGQFMNEEDEPVEMVELLTHRFGNLLEFFKTVDPTIMDYVEFADPAVVDKLISEIKELSMDHVYEIINDWEMEDDYYYDYLRDQGYQDEDGDIDWDAVEKNGDTWLGYNDEARMWFNKATSALEPSISSLTYIIADYTNNWSEHPTIENLDRLIAGNVEEEFSGSRNSTDAGLAEWIKYNIIVKKEGDGYKVSARGMK